MRKIHFQAGQLLVEVLVTIGLFAVLAPALLTGFTGATESRVQQEQFTDSTSLLNETQQAIRAVREKGWSSISSNGTFHPVQTNGVWSLVSGSETTTSFTRSVVISDVYRDATGKIAVSGTLDPSTKKIVTTISWTVPRNTSISDTQYVTRYLDNLSTIQTTVADFAGSGSNVGVLANTATSAYAGGEVTLQNNANADWCKPQNFIVNQVSLPKLSNAIYAQQGGAYLGSGDGVSNSPAFINVSVNTPVPPATPSASVAGTFNGAFTTNAIYSDGTYVYLATTNNPQILILDLRTTPYSQVGTVTIPGGQPANSVYLYGNILFATSGNTLYTFDLTTKTGGHTTVKSSINMVAGIWAQPTARQVVVVNNKAYVGTGGSLLGLQTFSFNASGGSLSFQAAALLTFSQQSQGLYVDASGHYAYIAFNNASGISFTRGFTVIDLTRTSWFLITYYPNHNEYDTGGMDPKGITVPTSNRAIIVGTGGSNQYQVVDTSNLSSMSMCGNLSIPTGIYGVSGILDQYSNAYSYIITGEAGNQFKIIRGGVGGGGYMSAGTFESPSFDAATTTAFNRIDGTLYLPALTTLTYQVAVATASAGSCVGSTYTYLGPDGTAGTVYTATGGAIPFKSSGAYSNPGRCFKYKASFTSTDTATSSALRDVTINYSP